MLALIVLVNLCRLTRKINDLGNGIGMVTYFWGWLQPCVNEANQSIPGPNQDRNYQKSTGLTGHCRCRWRTWVTLFCRWQWSHFPAPQWRRGSRTPFDPRSSTRTKRGERRREMLDASFHIISRSSKLNWFRLSHRWGPSVTKVTPPWHPWSPVDRRLASLKDLA